MLLNKRDPISLFFGLFLFVVGLYILSPIIFVVINAFNSAAYNVFPPEGFSLRWFQNALIEPRFRVAMYNSLIVGIGAMILAVTTGTMAAFALVRYRFRGRTLLKSFMFAPMLVPSIALGAALYLYYLRIGLYGGRLGLVLAHSLLGLPFVISIMTAVMLGIDPSLEEAAEDLGAGPLSTFSKNYPTADARWPGGIQLIRLHAFVRRVGYLSVPGSAVK
jgi:putative spermidine/putrescine transport system permease protein